MPYVASWERMAMEKEVEQGMEKGMEQELLEAAPSRLELGFGAEGRKGSLHEDVEPSSIGEGLHLRACFSRPTGWDTCLLDLVEVMGMP